LADAGFELTLWNRTRSRAEALSFGAVATSPAAAVRAADVVVSSLTGEEALRSTYLGSTGAISACAGKLFVEMSTAGPDVLPALADAVAAAGGRFVDAPILGAPPIVRIGQATVLLGGRDDDVRDATMVLSAIGLVRHVGPLGSAARLKLIANSMLADIVLAAAELQVAGEDAGLDADEVFWVLQRLAPALEPRRRGYTQDRHEPVLFALRDLRKDLGLALALYRASFSETPLTAVADGLVAAAMTESAELDITAVIRPYRRAASAVGEPRAAAVTAVVG
jgi:3-hydroxyisobutyrate dehydrogenase-like beta-hydroxyacid dehydrogenase